MCVCVYTNTGIPDILTLKIYVKFDLSELHENGNNDHPFHHFTMPGTALAQNGLLRNMF